ncbi:gas vesicle protein GvpK [Natrialbaceae archaeon A-gly3]
MTRIDVGEGNGADGVVTLVVTVVELLVDALEREAVRRMESGNLTEEEIDRLGRQLAEIEAQLEDLKDDQGIEEGVADLRGDLDGLVSEAIERLHDEEALHRQPGHSLSGGGEG